MGRDMPVGAAQGVILAALGRTASSWQSAEAIFAELGIVVRAVREGRHSVPRVKLARPAGGGFNEEGEGETWPADVRLSAEQRAALAPWWEGNGGSNATK